MPEKEKEEKDAWKQKKQNIRCLKNENNRWLKQKKMPEGDTWGDRKTRCLKKKKKMSDRRNYLKKERSRGEFLRRCLKEKKEKMKIPEQEE